ncbi:hypothetical protein AAMO2058_000860800 [Amorphochlora amoebiformis]
MGDTQLADNASGVNLSTLANATHTRGSRPNSAVFDNGERTEKMSLVKIVSKTLDESISDPEIVRAGAIGEVGATSWTSTLSEFILPGGTESGPGIGLMDIVGDYIDGKNILENVRVIVIHGMGIALLWLVFVYVDLAFAYKRAKKDSDEQIEVEETCRPL